MGGGTKHSGMYIGLYNVISISESGSDLDKALLDASATELHRRDLRESNALARRGHELKMRMHTVTFRRRAANLPHHERETYSADARVFSLRRAAWSGERHAGRKERRMRPLLNIRAVRTAS